MCSLFAVLKVDGPDVVTVRQVPDVGCVISVLCHSLRVVLSGLRPQVSVMKQAHASSLHGGKSQRHNVTSNYFKFAPTKSLFRNLPQEVGRLVSSMLFPRVIALSSASLSV